MAASAMGEREASMANSASSTLSCMTSTPRRIQVAAFYTRPSVVQLLAKMIKLYCARVYDPCRGSGGMFAQAEQSIYGARRPS